MLRRVNLIILLGLIVILILSFGASVSARELGSAKAALHIGEKQLGKPYKEATDGPKTFSCTGLMRYILNKNGVDYDAPWVAVDYLSKYERVSPRHMKPGDIVIFPGDHAAMYAGGNSVLGSNSVAGEVTYTDLGNLPEPVGVARPPYTDKK